MHPAQDAVGAGSPEATPFGVQVTALADRRALSGDSSHGWPLEFIPATSPSWGSLMCERDSSDDILRGNELSRRQFGVLGLSATLTAMLPAVAMAAEVSESEVEIKTPDGTCDAHFVHPAKATAAVLVWPDIFGLRPAFRANGHAAGGIRLCRTHGQTPSIVPSKGRLPAGRTRSSMRARSAPPRTCPMPGPS